MLEPVAVTRRRVGGGGEALRWCAGVLSRVRRVVEMILLELVSGVP